MPHPTIIFRRNIGAYVGKGAPITADEGDANLYGLLLAIIELQDNPPEPNEISAITQPSPSTLLVHLENGDTFGPFNLPVALFQPRGVWAADTAYAALDVFGVAGFGIYMVLRAHTTAADEEFDPDRTVDGDPAYAFLLPPGPVGPQGDNLAVGFFVDRSGYDGEDPPFYFLSLDGEGESGAGFAIYFRDDGVSELWGGPIFAGEFSGGGGGGSPVSVADEGELITSAVASLNFVGAGVSAEADSDGNVTVNIDAVAGSGTEGGGGGVSIAVADEGGQITAALASLDFVGAGVSAEADSDGHVTVTIETGGGSEASGSAEEAGGGYVSGNLIPLAADFGTPINLSSATLTDTDLGLVFAFPHDNSDDIRGVVQEVPASEPWTVTVGVEWLGMFKDFLNMGLLLYDGAKIVEWSHGGISNGRSQFARHEWSDFDSYSGEIDFVGQAPTRHVLLRLYNDGGNIIYSQSFDGVEWNVLTTQDKNDFLTPTHIGIGGLTNSQSGFDGTDKVRFFHYEAVLGDSVAEVTIGIGGGGGAGAGSGDDDDSGFTRELKTVATDTYTLISGDELKYLRFVNASGCVVTVPDDVFAENDQIPMRATLGQIVLDQDSLNATPHMPSDREAVSRGPMSSIHLFFISASHYDLTGDLEATSE